MTELAATRGGRPEQAGARMVGLVQPHNTEAEESVLGAMLLSAKAAETAAELLNRSDFYRPSHGTIFTAARELLQRGEPVDAITLVDLLEQRGELEAAGGRERIHELVALVPAASNVGYHAQIVKEMATLRGLILAGEDVARLGWERPGEIADLVDRAEQRIFELAQQRVTGDFAHIEELLKESFERITHLYESGADVTGIPSGFKELDKLTSGFQPGNLVILAARPSMGKSALALCIAANLGVRKQVPVALFTLEMSKIEVTQRLMCSEAKVESQRVSNGRLAQDDWSRLTASCDKLMKAPIYVDDSGSITMMELRSKARRLKAREPNLGLVVVDYLQLMTSGATVENRVQEVSQISRQLKVLARDLDVPILALSQLSRAVEQRHDKRPILSDLRESGCLAGESRVFLPDEGVYRPIRTLVGRTGFRVLALDQRTWQLEPRTVTNSFATGRKPVLKLRTRLGREIRATANHKFLAVAGWRRLDTITPGERIAIPRRLDQIPRRLDQRMASYVSAVGERRTRACREIWSYLEGRRGVTNCHVIPREAWTVLVKPALSRNGMTARQLHSAIGTSYCGSTLYRSNIGRGRALDVAEAVASDELRALATSDVYWDEVVAIEADGEEDVFDLTVDGLHNFVADDLCVHNSIEQDADLVAFVYRDEYYNPEESDQQGIAELILSKHRNGPTGTIKLSFLKRFAKFADLAAA